MRDRPGLAAPLRFLVTPSDRSDRYALVNARPSSTVVTLALIATAIANIGCLDP